MQRRSLMEVSIVRKADLNKLGPSGNYQTCLFVPSLSLFFISHYANHTNTAHNN